MYSRYKLALGSILEREDNNHFFIFRAIGPKVYNLTLKDLEVNKHQIKVECTEVKVPMKYWEKIQGEKELHSEAKNINKIDAYKIIENQYKHGKIVLATTYIDIGEKFNQEIKDSYLINKDVKADERKIIVEEINKKNSYQLIVTGLLEKLLLNDVDLIISLSYIGKSEREEYLRIGKLKASNNDKSKVGYYYALVSEKTAEEKIYKERMYRMIKHGYRFKIKSLYDL
jgi:superfamily II DNA or RNA helicase